MCFRSKNLYNRANYLIRQTFIETSKEVEAGVQEHALWLRYYVLDKRVKEEKWEEYKLLPAKVSQQILLLLDKNWNSFFQAMKSWKLNPSNFLSRPKLPKYKNKDGRNILIYTVQALSSKLLKQSIINPSKTSIKIKTKISQELIQQVRIIPKLGHYVLEVIYDKVAMPDKDLDINRVASCDFGVNNLAAITFNQLCLNPILINGRALKSINQYYNKITSYLRSKLPKKVFLSKKIIKLLNRREFKISNYLHHVSKFIVETCVKNTIGTLVLGKNINWKQESDVGKQNNQNFLSIPHDKLIKQIVYKAKLLGIKIILQEESYTSKASFVDKDDIPIYGSENGKVSFSGRRVKGKRGLYKTKLGVLINSDVNGSLNILKKAIPKAFDKVYGIGVFVVNPHKINLCKQFI